MKPKFKVGDVVLYKWFTHWAIKKIISITDNHYYFSMLIDSYGFRTNRAIIFSVVSLDKYGTLYKPINKPEYLK